MMYLSDKQIAMVREALQDALEQLGEASQQLGDSTRYDPTTRQIRRVLDAIGGPAPRRFMTGFKKTLGAPYNGQASGGFEVQHKNDGGDFVVHEYVPEPPPKVYTLHAETANLGVEASAIGGPKVIEENLADGIAISEALGDQPDEAKEQQVWKDKWP